MLLAQPPMPDRSEVKGQRKYSPWSSRFGVGSGGNDPTPEAFIVWKQWRKPRQTQGCTASNEEEEENHSVRDAD
jgi:hypothetical protein